MLKLHRVAVQIDRMVFLTLRTRKLIHDTTHHTGELVLTCLTDQGQLRTVCLIVSILPIHFLRESSCCHNLHRCTTAQTRSGRYVTVVQQVITAL